MGFVILGWSLQNDGDEQDGEEDEPWREEEDDVGLRINQFSLGLLVY